MMESSEPKNAGDVVLLHLLFELATFLRWENVVNIGGVEGESTSNFFEVEEEPL